MKIINIVVIVIFFLFRYNIAYSGGSKKEIQKIANTINNEIREYIKQTKSTSFAKGKYDVYVVNIHHADFKKQKICMTIGSISNTYEFEDVFSDYIYFVDNEIILLRVNAVLDSSLLNLLKYERFNQSHKIKVMNKFIPVNEGQIISDRGYMYISIIRKKITRKVKLDSELLPSETIYKKSLFYQMELKHR